jgi:AcrR family transcriptional regulator
VDEVHGQDRAPGGAGSSGRRPVTARGEKTREHLLDVAEQLFGARGVEAVSLSEIRVASGARNTAAVQFHFGNREGLLDALIQRHMTGIAALQHALYAEVVAAGRTDDVRSLVDVLVRPIADYLTRGPSERAWVKIMAELGQLPDLRLAGMALAAPPSAQAAGGVLYGLLTHAMPADLATERLLSLALIAVHLCANRARLQDDPRQSRAYVPDDVFVENLVDMTTAALFAPSYGSQSLRV